MRIRSFADSRSMAAVEPSEGLLGRLLAERGVPSKPSELGPERELGFGSGLLGEIQRRRGRSEPVPLTPEGYELLRLAPDPDEEPTVAALDSSHLIFVAKEGKYELLERPGPPPSVGECVSGGENGGKLFFVAKLAGSPLPLDPRACAYLQAL
jgi:hypothetical protein